MTVASFAALAATVLVLIGGVFILTRREVRNRSQAAARISEQARSLEQTVETLESRRAEIAMLNEAGSFLQSCARISEVAELAGRFLEQMFPETDGTLYIYASSRNRLHAVSRWGKAELGDHVDPLECWSLRRGLTHAYRADSAAPRCHHHGGHGDTLCVPLLAHGEAIGLLALQASGPAMLSEAIHRRADLLAHQLGPVLANIKLRETLNEQSIRDPLTNAFNRRYLDVVAEKEMAQAKRHGSGIAVAMIDVDHFKRFNDMHGHLAGDVALAGVVSHLQQSMRGEDWLFRYGGEEFLVLMRNVTVPEAELRLGQLVAGVRDVQLQIDGRALPGVTISAGLAGFPNHSTDFAELVTMADEALYCAKRAGRNQLCVAPVPDQNPLRLSA